MYHNSVVEYIQSLVFGRYAFFVVLGWSLGGRCVIMYYIVRMVKESAILEVVAVVGS